LIELVPTLSSFRNIKNYVTISKVQPPRRR
jgi:hypothetical protein